MADGKADVAHTLADALQKIENILSDDRNQGYYLTEEASYQNGGDDPAGLYVKIQNLASELRSSVERLDPAHVCNHKINIPVRTVNILIQWLEGFEVSKICSVIVSVIFYVNQGSKIDVFGKQAILTIDIYTYFIHSFKGSTTFQWGKKSRNIISWYFRRGANVS